MLLKQIFAICLFGFILDTFSQSQQRNYAWSADTSIRTQNATKTTQKSPSDYNEPSARDISSQIGEKLSQISIQVAQGKIASADLDVEISKIFSRYSPDSTATNLLSQIFYSSLDKCQPAYTEVLSKRHIQPDPRSHGAEYFLRQYYEHFNQPNIADCLKVYRQMGWNPAPYIKLTQKELWVELYNYQAGQDMQENAEKLPTPDFKLQRFSVEKCFSLKSNDSGKNTWIKIMPGLPSNPSVNSLLYVFLPTNPKVEQIFTFGKRTTDPKNVDGFSSLDCKGGFLYFSNPNEFGSSVTMYDLVTGEVYNKRMSIPLLDGKYIVTYSVEEQKFLDGQAFSSVQTLIAQFSLKDCSNRNSKFECVDAMRIKYELQKLPIVPPSMTTSEADEVDVFHIENTDKGKFSLKFHNGSGAQQLLLNCSITETKEISCKPAPGFTSKKLI